MLTLQTHISACASDIYDAVASGIYTLDMQLRAYDLLDELLAMKETGIDVSSVSEAAAFCKAYVDHKESLQSLICETDLQAAAEDRKKPFEAALNLAKAEAESAESLHEMAKETFGIWQNSGVFARQKALRKLRKSAGFRLESHRIGNYVAKTYDLMEAARRDCQKARQALFSANVTYKCKSGILDRIYSELQ